ncbi:MAG: signal peptide peptidase SppA [Pseudomonadales bacterium]|nr:signal peptide peptidase SppA [Pseudomonadales bacterium]
MTTNQPIRNFFAAIGRAFSFARVAIANTIIALIFLVVLISLVSAPGTPRVMDGTALILAPTGTLVEARGQLDPVDTLMGLGINQQTVVHDLIEAIETAADDKRVALLLLELSDMSSASLTHLHNIGDALQAFRETSGKPVIASGTFFSQGQYFLASFADEIYMHPLGELMLTGMSTYQPYFRDLLDRFKVKVHVFRAGEYKAAVEPYTRSDMSAEAKEANRTMMDQLWSRYLETIASNRELSSDAIRAYSNTFDELLASESGDMARVALNQGLIDELITLDAFIEQLRQRVGEHEDTFKQIDAESYLLASRRPQLPSQKPAIGVLTATGTILMGDQPPGTIGALSTRNLIQDVRKDEQIKALVLRVDSPGGSALASELIREELEQLQSSGIPVVVSMASTAASGGYWIAATADQIWASPSTITGSIGVYGIVPEIEETLATIGITRDGIGTTPMSGSMDLAGSLDQGTQNVLQSSVDFIYQTFLGLVARGRDMDVEAVDAIGQGRIWTGQDALELGLVDGLGNLEDSIRAAAELVELDDYDIKFLSTSLSPQEQFINQLIDNFGLTGVLSNSSWLSMFNSVSSNTALTDLQRLISFDDPKRIYAICATCRSVTLL